jgi:hypothetical protein
MTTDYRALCAELVSSWDDATGDVDFLDLADIMDRARAALAQPEPVGPTDEELLETVAEAVGYEHVPTDENCLSLARAVLARYARPAIAPILVSERLPGPEDCDAEGRCWVLGKVESDWRLISMINPGVPKLSYCFSHWLPHWALPLPSPSDHH